MRVWVCGSKSCGHEQAEEAPFVETIRPKILYFDIETALMEVAVFSLYQPQKYISNAAIIQSSYITTWAACWVDSDAEYQYIYSDRVREDEARANSDRRALQWLWQLMDRADYIVGHNSDQFDVKLVNYRFFRNGMGLPYTFKQSDTLKLARKYFRAESNKLDYLARISGGNGKHDMEYDDWHRIRTAPTGEDLQKMENYCRNDVREGIDVFIQFRRELEQSGRTVIK